MGEEKLTEAQLNAIRAPIDKPLMILAAAGSGKTLVLSHRILYLVSQGISPNDILAVTFTRRAGQDLLHRLQRLAAAQQYCIKLPSHALGIRVGTFHSFCLSVLRAFPNYAGLAPNFVVFTPKMQIDLLETLIEEWHTERQLRIDGQSMHLQEKLGKVSKGPQGRHKSVGDKKSFFKAVAYRLLQHLRKVQFVKPHEAVTDAELIGGHEDGLSKWVLQQYHERLLQVNGIDFNSFIRYTVNILQNWPSALESAGLKAKYIFVDEFQDTDVGQFELLNILSKDNGHITIVGDDDQQIYSWRGAAGFYNIKRFENIFMGVTITKLEQNFRSTGAIVASARSLISKNKSRIPKTLRTASSTGVLMTICECRNGQCEATAIADFILSLREQGVPLQEIAILYRLQRIGLEIQHGIQVRGIECHIRGSGSQTSGSKLYHSNGGDVGLLFGDVFYDILAVLRLAISESDEQGCKRLLSLFCPSMSLSIRDCLSYLQVKRGFSLLQAIKATRSHLLGLLTCDDLSSYAPAKSISKMSDSDHLALEGMHSMLKLIAATKNDSKHLGLKDITFNVLQQISYIRGSKDVPDILKSGQCGNKGKNGKSVVPSQKSDINLHNNFEFAGIKSLLKEAALFDGEIMCNSKISNNAVNKENKIAATHQMSYMDMKQQRSIKGRSQTSDKMGFVGTAGYRIDGNSPEKIKIFLDQVTLKMHDNELGEGSDFRSFPSNETASSSADSVGVTLSTIHQAKGLEWTAVILVRANEGVMPLTNDDFMAEPSSLNIPEFIDHGTIGTDKNIGMEAANEINMNRDGISLLGPPTSEAQGNFSCGPNREGIEEERRLMYVALTRAKRFVLVTHLMTEGGQQMVPSRFLADIPRGLVCRTTCYESKTVSPDLPTTKLETSCNENVKKKAKAPSRVSQSQNTHSENMKRKTALQLNASESSADMASLRSHLDCPSLRSCEKIKNDESQMSHSHKSGNYSDDSDFERPVRKERKKRNEVLISSESDE